MKKILYLFMLGLFSVGLLNAEDSKQSTYVGQSEKIANKAPQEINISKEKKNQNTFQAERELLMGVWNQYMGGNKHSPVAYEPKSGFFYITVLDITDSENQGDPVGDIAHLLYRDMNTGSWGHDTTRMNTSQFEYYNYPSIAVTNPTNSKTRDNQVIYSHFTFWDEDPDNAGFILQQGARTYISSEYFGYGYDYRDMDAFPYIGPTTNESDNNNNYKWDKVDLLSIDRGEEVSEFYFASDLAPLEDTDRFGAYGIHGYDVVFGDKLVDKVPDKWGFDDFRYDPGNGGSWGNIPSLGADLAGNIYMAVNHHFPHQENSRTPGVCKSEDKGMTWSEFNVMDASVITDYAADMGFADVNIGQNISYDIDGFKVLGTDSYSYIFRINLYEAQGGNVTNVHLVEGLYENDKWTLSFIADLNTSSINSLFTTTDDARYIGMPLRITANTRGHEVEVALTADGKYEVVKWIDENQSHTFALPENWEKACQLNTTTGNYQSAGVIESFAACDVYMSWKEVGTNTWNGPFNVTNDTINSFNTFMPDVVPSRTNIPMMMLRTADYEGTDYDGLFNQTHDIVEQYVIDKITKAVEYMELDATKEYGAGDVKTLAHNFANDTLSFSYVGTDRDSKKTIILRNKGNATINITGFESDGDSDPFAFATENLPISLKANESTEIDVTFSPSEIGKLYSAEFYVMSDADNNEDIKITLFGMGVYKSVGEENLDLINLNISPNPIEENGLITLSLKESTPQNIKIGLYDINGKKVAELYEGKVLPNSEKSFKINSEEYTNGNYNLIIELNGKFIRKSLVISK